MADFERVLSRRCDYLKISVLAPPSACLSIIERYKSICDGHSAQVYGRTSSTLFKAYPGAGSTPTAWHKYFECWGTAADALAQALQPVEWHAVSRVDWREEIPTPPLSLKAMETRAHLACQGGIRITTDVSRARSRKFGRDGGGQLLGIGSHKSDSRLTVYIRGDAEWAVEAQLSGKVLQGIMSSVFMEHSIEPFPSIYSLIEKYMSAKLRAMVLQRLALPFKVLSSEEPMSPQEELVDLFDQEPTHHHQDINRILEACGPEAVVDWINMWYEDTGYRVVIQHTATIAAENDQLPAD
jgi:hypothetical protein